MRRCLVVALLGLVLGCGKTEFRGQVAPSPSGVESTVPHESPSPGTAKSDAPVPSGSALARKIIYSGQVDLVVEDFSTIPSQVEALAKQFGGFLASSKLTSLPGAARRGTWTIRVPVERYEDCLAAARKLGEVRNVSSNSQDITEEYYDLEARIRNKKQEEDRLLKLLANATGKLDEILSVERELSRVRGEIEQMEGRKRMLTDLAAMSTVNLSVEEIKGYVPEESAGYLTRVRRAFDGSVRAMVFTATEISIFAVALVPWVPVLALFGLVAFLVLRRRSTRRQ